MRSKRFWLGLAISLLFLFLLVWRIDLDETARTFREADYRFLIPGIVIYFFAAAIRTLRWWLLLLPLRQIAVRRLFPVLVVGYMANNLLPVRLGEVVRSYYLGQREAVSKSAALATIVVERVFDGVTLLFLLGVVSAFLPVTGLLKDLARDTGIPLSVMVTGATLPFVLVLGFLTLVAYQPWRLLRLAGAVASRLPGRLETRILGLAELFITGLGILRQPRRLAALFFLSITVWLMEVAMYFAIGFSFDLSSPLGGVGAMLAAMVAVTAISNLAISIPSSQGGIGPFELFAAATLVVLGVKGETAAAYAVVLHIALLVPVTLLGLLYLWTGRESLVRLVRLGMADFSVAGGHGTSEVSAGTEEAP